MIKVWLAVQTLEEIQSRVKKNLTVLIIILLCMDHVYNFVNIKQLN